MMGRLQDVILEKRAGESALGNAVQTLNATVAAEARDLNDEFLHVAKVPTQIRLPDQIAELFRAFSVATKSGDEDFPLNVRGDGIRSRFLPSLLHYISTHSRFFYIWGFEEPENSLEHALATGLAQEVVNTYSKRSQVLVTSHSPAFFSLRDNNVCIYRVSSDGSASTTTEKIFPGTGTLHAFDSVSGGRAWSHAATIGVA